MFGIVYLVRSCSQTKCSGAWQWSWCACFERFSCCFSRVNTSWTRTRLFLNLKSLTFSVATWTTWMKPKAPCLGWSFLASFLNQPIGLLRINDELEDVFILYAPAPGIMRNYSQDAVQASIKMNNFRIMENLCQHPSEFWRTFQIRGLQIDLS